MFLLFALTPQNLFKCFLSIKYDRFTKFEYLTKWSFVDIEALAEMELTSVPFILNSSLRGKFLKKIIFCCWKLPYALSAISGSLLAIILESMLSFSLSLVPVSVRIASTSCVSIWNNSKFRFWNHRL